MLNNTPIEETFRDAFDNFEADVNPQVWTNIETQITTPSAPAAGNAASQAAKTILSASKFSALTYGIVRGFGTLNSRKIINQFLDSKRLNDRTSRRTFIIF